MINGLIIHDCEQGSEAWHKVRAGMPTSSEFSTVMASGKDGGASKTRRTYMLKLAGEIITGEPMENFSNAHMERGKAMEDVAREHYAFVKEVNPERVGFITNGLKGCSPDSLIEKDGGLEIKTALPHIQIDRLLRNELPPEHKAQVQGSMWVAEREWWDYCSYWPKIPPLIVRVYRDESYLKILNDEIERFNAELDALVQKVRSIGVEMLHAA